MKNVSVPDPDHNEDLARIVDIIGTVLGRPELEIKWFVSFGTMLYYFRDKNMGVPFQGDFDISILGKTDWKYIVQSFAEWGYNVRTKLIHDKSGHPFQIVFKHDTFLFDIDLYFWVNANKYWWHTYDYYKENKSVPKKYIFKGTPEYAFKGKPFLYPWAEIAQDIQFPYLYGTLLDLWYPGKEVDGRMEGGWFIPDKNYGQTHAEKIVKLTTCSGLENKLK
jgi:hypothetical protein